MTEFEPKNDDIEKAVNEINSILATQEKTDFKQAIWRKLLEGGDRKVLKILQSDTQINDVTRSLSNIVEKWLFAFYLA